MHQPKHQLKKTQQSKSNERSQKKHVLGFDPGMDAGFPVRERENKLNSFLRKEHAMDSTKKDNLVLMGQIGAAHGIKGEVRIKSFTQNPLDLAAYSPLQTGKPGQTITIKKAREQKGMLVAVLEESRSRNDAEALNGTKLYVERGQLPQTEDDDEFYHTDLVGLKARTPDGEELGSVAAVQNYGAGDVLEVRPLRGPTALYPFTRQGVPTINLAEGYLVIDLPDEIIVDDDEAFE